nr:MAG TPA: CASP8-associated protein 2 [Herelleviridae sp.]
MTEHKNLEYELVRLMEENARLEKENADIQSNHMKLYNNTKDEIRELKAEIERLRAKCGEVPCEQFDCLCEKEEIDIEALICELQDQHQQDCIRINDLTTTIHVLSGLYSTLRKTVGMD